MNSSARHNYHNFHELRNAEQFFSAIVESSDDAIITKDLNGIITTWNKGAERLFGYKADEVIGKPVAILIPEDLENEEPNILARLRKGERIDHYETIRRRKDGKFLNISLTVSPVKDAAGVIVGASKIARDITHRKQMELELLSTKDQLTRANDELERRVVERTAMLQRALAQMEEFSYSVSHDLRAPVRAMTGYAQSVLEDYGGQLSKEVGELLSRIVSSGSRMERLIHDVLTYSRLARFETRLEPIAVDSLVPEIVRQYPSMQQPNAEVTIRHPLLPMCGHEPLLTQAISNLLANAVKFVSPGVKPQVRVRTEVEDHHVRLWVEDNGIGIKPEYQNRLFGMFERVHQSKQYEGTGIGLAIVRKSIEKMGGQVGVISDGQNGSKFWIELPGPVPCP